MKDSAPVEPATDSESSTGSFVKVLAKGLAVLRAFEVKPQATIAEIGEAAGLDRAGARRILLTLEQLGYVRSESRLFSLTPRVLQLGFGYLSALPFWTVAQPVMEELVEEVNETCAIGVLDADEVVFVLRVPTRRLLSFDPQIGTRVPAYAHSMGRILLAQQNPDDLDAYLRRAELKRIGPSTIGTVEHLRESIAADRDNGWSFSSEQFEEGICGIAVPILNRLGKAVAALDVSFDAGVKARARAVDEILPKLRMAARRMSLSLRGAPR